MQIMKMKIMQMMTYMNDVQRIYKAWYRTKYVQNAWIVNILENTAIRFLLHFFAYIVYIINDW